jgi:hypothetical protein
MPSVRHYSPPRRALGSYVAEEKGTCPFWQTACCIRSETVMVFMLSMIFAFELIAMTTVATTIFAVLLMRWMLEFDRSLCHVHISAEAFLDG